MKQALEKKTRRITVKVAGKAFAMTVPAADEEKYRRAAEDINELISAYKGSFVAEAEDYLIMAAIQMAVSKVSLEMEREMTEEMERLKKLEEEIDGYLNNMKA